MRARRSGLSHVLSVYAAVIAVSVAGLGVCAPARAGDLHNACPASVADCTAVTGRWVEVPAGGNPDEIIAQDQLVCPSGVAVGYSYSAGNVGQTLVFVEVFPAYPNTHNIWNGEPQRVFFEIVNTGGQTTVQDQIGCAPQPPARGALSRTPVRRAVQEKMWTLPLERSQARSYTRRCPAGTRVVTGTATVELLARGKPSSAELREVRWHASEEHAGETVRVRTTNHLRARTKLTILLACAPSSRAGTPGRAVEPPYQCPPDVAGCTIVTGGQLKVPLGNFSALRDITARDQLTCPSGSPVGFTYSGGTSDAAVLVEVFPGPRGPVNTALFAIVNHGSPTTVQLRLGCAPAPNVVDLTSPRVAHPAFAELPRRFR